MLVRSVYLFSKYLLSTLCLVIDPTIVYKTSKVSVIANTYIMSGHINTMKKMKHFKEKKRDWSGKVRGGSVTILDRVVRKGFSLRG